MKELAAAPGLPVGTVRGRPAVGADVLVEEWGTRPLGALAAVAASPIHVAARRVQYWMLNGVVRARDAGRIDPRLRYELTYMADRPIGWERPKTAGHVHGRPSPGEIGFAEICEVLEGTAGFMIQDLRPGPSAIFAALVTVRPGERIVLPPLLHHATFHLAGAPLVFSDVISRRITTDYSTLSAAQGTAYLIDTLGSPRPNLAYARVPPLLRFSAEEWSGPANRPLYTSFVDDPASLTWLDSPGEFPARFPRLWERLEPILNALDRS